MLGKLAWMITPLNLKNNLAHESSWEFSSTQTGKLVASLVTSDQFWILYIHMGSALEHDDVIKWKHFRVTGPFVRGTHRSLVDFLHRDKWRGALVFYLICAWTNGWANNRDAGDLLWSRYIVALHCLSFNCPNRMSHSASSHMLPYLTDWAVGIHENNSDKQNYCIYTEEKIFLSLHHNHQIHDLETLDHYLLCTSKNQQFQIYYYNRCGQILVKRIYLRRLFR